jgi:GDP-L-fucose synthase
LTNQLAVKKFFYKEKPDQVYLAAAKVGGIHANNTFPAEFIYENLMIETNIIHSAFLSGVKKLLFLGSSCIYPKSFNQPIKEFMLLKGILEPTNEPYAISKIAGIKLCESYNRQYGLSHNISYRSIMPTNLYGPGDSYHQENSHVIPGLIRRFHEAKVKKKDKVIVWGSGKPKREFLYVDDLASASIMIMNIGDDLFNSNTSPFCAHINVGYGTDLTINSLVKKIKKIVGYHGSINFDKNKPDGTKRKLLDSKKILDLGWKPKYSLDQGLKKTYNDFLSNMKD